MASPEEPRNRLETMPTWMIGQVSTLAHRMLTDELAAEGSRGYDYRVLAALHDSGPASQAEIGRRSRLDRSDVVATINALVNRGFVTRIQDQSDRRRNIVAITPKGAQHFGRLDRIILGVQDRLLSPLDRTERAVLMDLLTRIVDKSG